MLIPTLTLLTATSRGEGVTMERVAFGGWNNNVRISNGEVELIVTLDVGPRILVYRVLGADGKPGVNVFHVAESSQGKTGGMAWVSYGGHRLWAGPEDLTRTYAADNGPVEFVESAPGIAVFRPAPESAYGLQKEIEVRLAPKGTKVTVVHRITNVGAQATSLAPWCLSVMAPGGKEIIPMPQGHPHPGPPANARSPEDYAPDRKLVLWPFFDFTDPRWHFGSRFITLTQDPTRGPTKIGLAHALGWVAYEIQGDVFIKRFGLEKGQLYPDGGCNFETFTHQDMLEIESLGPMVNLAPNATATHEEQWELIPSVGGLPNEGIIERELVPRLMARPTP
jgi:hypothetical protein